MKTEGSTEAILNCEQLNTCMIKIDIWYSWSPNSGKVWERSEQVFVARDGRVWSGRRGTIWPSKQNRIFKKQILKNVDFFKSLKIEKNRRTQVQNVLWGSNHSIFKSGTIWPPFDHRGSMKLLGLSEKIKINIFYCTKDLLILKESS